MPSFWNESAQSAKAHKNSATGYPLELRFASERSFGAMWHSAWERRGARESAL
jgi:hypothetical protein